MMSLQTTRFDVRRYETSAVFHTHEHHQIVLPIQGTLSMIVDDRKGDVSGLSGAAIPAGQEHGFSGSSENEFFIVDVPARRWPGFENQTSLWSATGDMPFVRFEESLRGFCETVIRDSRIVHGSGVRAEVAGSIIVESLERSLGVSPQGESGPLAKAVAFIESRFADLLTVQAISREAGVSESRLYALFEDHFHISPQRFVVRRRMEMAGLLLSESQRPIAEIAHWVGYGDQSAFSRAFRRFWSETPAAYRRTRKKTGTA